MADQQRKVSLVFKANASQAKNEINDLVMSLQKIQATPTTLIDSKGIKEASKAALELQTHLQKAVNTDTGKLDLNRFANSLSASGKTLEQYRATLTKIGPTGNAAFKSVLTSINNAEASTVRLTKGMRDFVTTMKNTVKWQISSSMMHGLMGAIQSATGYAQQLDRSLNDIRIVSGASAEEMARFAVEANRAAQALSTTTTKYTDAALIFYQQGLNDQQVKERTEAVIKMANVTGEASKDVSSYMTAIWNNFADGSKSLEYYADVITKLGAATAASSEEIAGGLEKFAAIGNTIGLSYEYATSMITTIVDKTRQSEDVVGTALKTILARIQGLNLGETLDDGTTLNKYSGALKKVGINIKDASGQLKDMDIILDELGSKWNTFSKDTQIALAQVVGGVRQYNQIIALMDNWGSFQKNVQIAETSTGSLNEQADIYAESWEAARNRVTAAAQGIYDALLDEKVFIQLDDMFTHLLNGVNGLVSGMGGMVPILGTIGGFITQKFAKELPVTLNGMAQNMAILTGKAQNRAADWQAETTRQAEQARDFSVGDARAEAEYETIRRVSAMREKLLRNQSQMNSEEIAHYEALIKNEEAIGRIVESRAEALGNLEKETQELKEQIALRTAEAELEKSRDYFGDSVNTKAWDKTTQQAREEIDKRLEQDAVRQHELKKKPVSQRSAEEKKELDEIARRSEKYYINPRERQGKTLDYYNELDKRTKDLYKKKAQDATTKLVDASSQLKQVSIAAQEFGDFAKEMKLEEGGRSVDAFKEKLETLKTTLSNIGADTSQIDDIITSLGNASEVETPQIEAATAAIDDLVRAKGEALAQAKMDATDLGISNVDIEMATAQGEEEGVKSSGVLDRGDTPEIDEHQVKTVEALTTSLGALMSAYSAVQAVTEAWNVVMDKNTTGMEKAGAIIGGLLSVMMALNSVTEVGRILKLGDVAVTYAKAKADIVATGTSFGLAGAIKAVGVAIKSVPVIGWILAIISALISLIAILSKLDFRTDEEKKIDELKKKTEALSEAQSNLANHINEVQSAWSNYENMKTALEECTTGTQEWNEALSNCNQAVLQILSLAPHLAEFVQYNPDGSISLGGAGYEEYMENLTRTNAAIDASKLITNNEIKQEELGINTPINHQAYEELNKRWLNESEELFNEDGYFSNAENYIRAIEDVFEVFGEDIEGALLFLERSGLATDENDAGALYADYQQGDLYASSYDSTARLNAEDYWEFYKDISPLEAMSNWGADLNTWDAYEKSSKAAYATFFGNLEDYNYENLNVYTRYFEDAIDEALADSSNSYVAATEDELRNMMVSTFKGELEDYEDMDAESMRYALAMADVTTDMEIMDGIISSVNTTISGLNDVGQSLIRTGNLASAALSQVGGQALIAPINWTAEEIQGMSNVKHYTPRDLNTGEEYMAGGMLPSLGITEELEKAASSDYVSKALPGINDEIASRQAYEADLQLRYDNANSVLNKAEGILNNAYNYDIYAAQDATMAAMPQSSAQRSDWAHYDYLRAILPTESTEVPGWRKVVLGDYTSDYEDTAADIRALEDKYGAEFLQSRPLLDEDQAWYNKEIGSSEDWYVDENAVANYRPQAPLLIDSINLALEEAGLSIRATAENLEAAGEESFESLLTTKLSPYRTVQEEYDNYYSDDNYFNTSAALESYKSTLLNPYTVPYSEEQLLDPNFDPYALVRDYLSEYFVEEDVEAIIADYLEDDTRTIDWAQYIPKEQYQEWVDGIRDTLGENFSDLFASPEDFEAFELLDPKEQYEYLNTEEIAYDIDRTLNKANEDVARRIFQIEEGVDLFEGLIAQGVINADDLTYSDYGKDFSLVYNAALEKDPETLYRHSMMSAVGLEDDSKYIIDSEDPEKTEENAAKFAEDFGILSAEEIADGVSWQEIAERFNELVIDNMEMGLSAWNAKVPERFKTNLTVNEETGEYVLPEGTEATEADNFFSSLVSAGASVMDISNLMADINAIAPGLTTGEFGNISSIMQEMIANGADVTKVMEAFNLILERTHTKGEQLTDEELSEIMQETGLSTAFYGEEIQGLNGIIYSAIDGITAFSSSLENLEGVLQKLQGLIDITTGTELSTEDYEDIEKYIPEEYKHLFMRSAGGYTFYGTEEQGKEIEIGARQSAWQEETERRDSIQTAGNTSIGNSGMNFDLEDENLNGSIMQWVMGGALQDQNFIDYLLGTGTVGEGRIQALQGLGEAGADAFDPETGEYIGEENAEAEEAGYLIADAVISYLKGDYEGASSEEAQMRMTGMRTTDELDAAVKNGDITIGTDEGQITQEQFDAYRDSLADQEFKTEMSELSLDPKEVEGLSETLQELAKNLDADNKGANELSEELIDNEKAAKEVAKEIKRYDRALESVRDNQEEWAEALESGNPDDMAKAIGEMDEAYSDMLDIDPGSLSEGFLQNAENLELMKEAAEGSEEAYAELQARAEDDLLIQAGIDPNSDLWGEINSLQDTIHNEIDDIEVGASIDNAQAIQAMNELINMAGMTAEEATNYLASMGVDAEVEQVTVPESSSYTGADAKIDTEDVTYVNPITGEEVTTKVPSITYTETPAVTTEDEKTATALRVTSATKSSGGGFKHNNSSAGSGSGSRRRGGGGGGGGGGGRRAPRAEKKKDTEKERYHTIKNVLEDLTDAFDKVSKARDRAFGKSRIKLMEEEEKAIQKLATAQRDYLDEIEAYLETDRENLNQLQTYSGVELQFDENGTLLNFEDLQNAMWDKYNAQINDNGEVKNKTDEEWQKWEEEWQRQMDLLTQYEETQDLWKEQMQAYQDYINQLYDLQLEEVTYSVEVDIDASNDALEILDYLLNRIEDDAWAAADAIAYMGDKATTMLDQNNTYTGGIREILMNHTKDLVDSEGKVLQSAQLTEDDVNAFMAGDQDAVTTIMGLNDYFTADEVASLRDYNSQLIAMNESLLELRESVYSKVLDSFEKFNEEMDRSIEKIDHLSALTDNYRNIIDIVGKKNLNISNALLESLGQADVEQRINRVDATKTKRDTIAAEVARAEEALAAARAANLEDDIRLWEDTLDEMRDSLDEAEEDFMQSWEDALDSIREQFELAVANAVETLSDALAGPLMSSMDQLQDAFDRQSTIAERYLPDYEKIYELNKLNRDITNSIDETDNIKAKQELADLQAEINALEESEAEISEYQMENLRRRYELKLAEIALTEAQDAKSQVQMSRDADGNWSYVYTADESQVAEAEQNYEDRLFAMQEANAEYINSMQDNIVQLETEMAQKLEEIMLDETLSAEERMAKMQEVTTFYQGQMYYYMDELSLVLGENRILYEEDWAKYSELTGYKISANQNYVDNFNETALSTLTGFQTMEEFQTNFNEAIGHPDSHGLLYDLNNAYETWVANTEAAMNAAGTSTQNFASDMADDVTDIISASEDATDAIETMGETVTGTFDKIVDAVESWSNAYSATIDSILARNQALAESFNTILQAWSDFEDATTVDDSDAGDSTEETEPTDEPEEEEEQKPEGMGTVTVKKGYRMNIRTGPGVGHKDIGTVDARKKKKSYTYSKKDGKWVYIDALGGWMNGQYKKYTWLTPFDTGGYTGSWGSEGRVAMLHEKELVLNKEDTSNLLSAIGIIRQIAQVIDLNAYSSAGFGSSLIGLASGSAGAFEQNVHITAEFPNATNRDEIYAAFMDIANLASQYANR